MGEVFEHVSRDESDAGDDRREHLIDRFFCKYSSCLKATGSFWPRLHPGGHTNSAPPAIRRCRAGPSHSCDLVRGSKASMDALWGYRCSWTPCSHHNRPEFGGAVRDAGKRDPNVLSALAGRRDVGVRERLLVGHPPRGGPDRQALVRALALWELIAY